MSATQFYLDKGFTPAFRTSTMGGAGTYEVWTPTTSTRIVLTALQVSANAAGTIRFYFGNLAGSKIFEFVLAGSSTIAPVIGAIESTMYDRSIFATVSAVGTEGMKVNLQGFELP